MYRDLACSKCKKVWSVDEKERIYICPNCGNVIDVTQGIDQYMDMSILDSMGKEKKITRENFFDMVDEINSEYKRGLIHTVKEEGHDYIVIDKQKIDITDWDNNDWISIFVEAVYNPFLAMVQKGAPMYTDEACSVLNDDEIKVKGLIEGYWNEYSTLEQWIHKTKLTLRWRINKNIPDIKFKALMTPEWCSNATQTCEDTLIAIEKFEKAPKHIQRL